MISIADGSIRIQTSAEAQPATPSWLGEVALVASHLQQQGILNKIGERVRFARRRFGRYDALDFLAVQIALRHQPTGCATRCREGKHPAIHHMLCIMLVDFSEASC